MSNAAAPNPDAVYKFENLAPPYSIPDIDVDAITSGENAVADIPSCGFSFLSASDTMYLRSLPQYDPEVWLISVRPLRCFIHPGPGYVDPLRPPALLITRLRHQPAVLRCKPLRLAPDEPVNGVNIVEDIHRTIMFPRIPDYLPSDANGRYPVPNLSHPRIPHRPGKILFEDISLAYTCVDSLRSLGIMVQVVRMELPLQPFLTLFSQSLVKLGIAQATKMTMAPGLNDITNLPPSIYRGFLLSAREFAQANPWIVIPDKQAFRIRFDPVQEGPMSQEPLIAWANINGQGEFRQRFVQIEKMGKSPDSLPYNHTISIYFKRYDLEMNLMKGTYLAQLAQEREEQRSKGVELTGPIMVDLDKIPVAEGNPWDIICACCKKSDTAESSSSLSSNVSSSSSSTPTNDTATTPTSSDSVSRTSTSSSSLTKSSSSTRFSRCTRCRDVYYCSETCQKNHWKDHKPYCDTNKIGDVIKAPTPGKQIGYNAVREIRIAFQRPFDVPCGDIEIMERLNVLPDHRDNYPLLMTVKNGGTYPPSPGEIGWALRVLSALVAFWRKRPDTVHILRPTPFEETVRLTRTVYPLSTVDGTVPSTKSSTTTPSERTRLNASQIQAEYSKDVPWYDKFMDNTECYVRTDPILSREETKELIDEITELTKNKFDKAVIKPGIYVPTVSTLPPKDYVDFADDNEETTKDTEESKKDK